MSSVIPQTKDCNVVASKLTFLLDDLLWVLTDSQLKAMMKYAESLSEAMEKSAQQRKSLAPEPVQVRGTPGICLGWGGRWLALICATVVGNGGLLVCLWDSPCVELLVPVSLICSAHWVPLCVR